MTRTLIYGIGNPYRCDDAVGIKVAEELKKKLNGPVIKSGTIDGFAVLDEIAGFDYVIFIDSIKTENGIPGNIYTFSPEIEKHNLVSSHTTSFLNILHLGEKFGYKIPKKIKVYAVEIKDNASFSEDCTREVKTAIPQLVQSIIDDLQN